MKIPVWIVTQHVTVSITIPWKKNFVSSFEGLRAPGHLKIAVSPRSSRPQQQKARRNGCFRRLAEWGIRQKTFWGWEMSSFLRQDKRVKNVDFCEQAGGLFELFLGAARNRAFENSRFSSLLTSPAAKSEEKQLFSQASGMGRSTKTFWGWGMSSFLRQEKRFEKWKCPFLRQFATDKIVGTWNSSKKKPFVVSQKVLFI